jgi:hypothetical protein
MVTEQEHIRQSVLDEAQGNKDTALALLADYYHLAEQRVQQLEHENARLKSDFVSWGYARRRPAKPTLPMKQAPVAPLDIAKEAAPHG